MRKTILQQAIRISEKSQKYLGIDAAYFLRGSFYGTIQQLVGVVSGLAASYLFGHFVSKTVFGEYNLVLSILGMITFLSLPGIDTALIPTVAKGKNKSFIQGTQMKLKSSLLGIPVLLIFSFVFFLRNNPNVGKALIISSISYPLLYSFSTYQSFLVAKKKFALQATLASLSSIFFLTMLAIAILSQGSTIQIIIFYLIGMIIPSVVAFQYCRRFVNKKDTIDPDLPSYGTFLTVLSILPWLSGHLGNVILGTLLGVESLAIFTVANRFLNSIQKNFMVFYKPVTAKLAAQTTSQHLETFKNHAIKLVFIGVLLSTVMWLATGPLINFFFTKKYQESIFYGQLLSLALIPLPLSWVLSDMMIYQKRKKVQIFMSIVPPIIKIILYLIFIPLFKIMGLVAVFLLARYIELVIPLIVLLKQKK